MFSVDLVEVLKVCVRGALAAQRYILLDLLRIAAVDPPLPNGVSVMRLAPSARAALVAALRRAVGVRVKSCLAHKTGAAAADLVTTADIVTQAVLVDALRRAFPDSPFTVVGEEADADGGASDAASTCTARYFSPRAPIPLESALQHAAGDGVVVADTLDALRQRVGVFIDPIDATNCFVDGSWEAPMTLIGITLDGVPIGGVVNRLFDCTKAAALGADAEGMGRSLSFVFARGAKPVVVHEGRLVSQIEDIRGTPNRRRAASTLRLVSSAVNGDALRELEALRPTESCPARGAGNKMMRLVSSAVREGRVGPPCDVFFAAKGTIRKWDTCAPHAMLRALGGEVWTAEGKAVRYSVANDAAAADTALPDGIIAASPFAKEEVTRRMRWAPMGKL